MHFLFRSRAVAVSITSLLVCAFFPLPAGNAITCTQESLLATFRQKRNQAEDVTHLQSKSWWNGCPLSVRQAVYAQITSATAASASSSVPMKSNLPILGQAPELQGLGEWFNSEPLSIRSLKGKVVLVHFWTFACINCIHTLASVEGYWEKYGDKNVVILGVHTPEFTYEKSAKNLQDAITKYGLNYPIVQDNDFKTWNAYNNRYWPAFYLIDAEGNIRYEHFGEGQYGVMNDSIQELLDEAGA